MNSPRVSVLLPVYNGAEYLHEAINSILAQTFSNFELIIINDGSTDGTRDILDRIVDSRVRVIHQHNMGLALTLNKAISLSCGEYIARQDADDISLPDRLKMQVAYMDEHPECALLGTWSTIYQERNKTHRGHAHPISNGELQIRLLFDSFFVHSSVLIRKQVLVKTGVYPTDPQRNPPEDFDLWLRIAQQNVVANLPQRLIIYRELPASISRSKAELLQRRAISIASENIASLISNSVDMHTINDLVAILRGATNMVSTCPDWDGFQVALKSIRVALVQKWPQDHNELEVGYLILRRKLRVYRFRKLVEACKVLIAISRIKRFFRNLNG